MLSSSSLGTKRKGEVQSERNESTNETESRVKRIKNESGDANRSIKEEGETSAEELLFSNYLLLRSIFPNLGVNDLKSCRQVNRLWSHEATQILLKSDCLSAIEITNDTVKLHDPRVYNSNQPRLSLIDFQRVVANSDLFPCIGFAINNDFLTKDIIDFFRKYGHLAKSFQFEAEYFEYDEVEDRATAYDILLLAAGYFRNLQTLKLSGYLDVSFCQVKKMAIQIAPKMRNLTTLELDGEFNSHIIALILKKAKNLKNIYLHSDYDGDFNYDICLKQLAQVKDAIPRLKNIILNIPSKISSLQVYRRVLEQSPRFSRIQICEPCPSIRDALLGNLAETGRILTALLQQCSESITEIVELRALGHIPELSLPALPNVKELKIQYNRWSWSSSEYTPAPLLPPEANLADVFPNVTSIIFGIWDAHYSDLKPDEIFSEAVKSPMFSVRNISVVWEESFTPEIYVEKLCTFLPNVTSATFPLLSDSSYKHIWKLSALQELHLIIETKPKKDFFASLDSAFTGFSVGAVKRLYRKNQQDLNLLAEEVAALRIKPSIVDLKDLRKLSLDLRVVAGNDKKKKTEVSFGAGVGKKLLEVNGRIILSYISKRFGFDLCPQLKANVCVKVDKQKLYLTR